MGNLKNKIKNNAFVVNVIMFFRKLFGNNVIKAQKGNVVKIDGLMQGANVFVRGQNNAVYIQKPITNSGLKIFINGNKNKISIEENCVLKNLSVWIEDDENEIWIGQIR